MGILTKLTGTSSSAEFAKVLAADIAKRYPPHLDSQPGKRPSVNRLTRIMEEACTKAIDYQRERRLGWWGKAALGNSFRWELQEMGYQPDFVSFATEALVVHISKAASSNKPPSDKPGV